MTVYKKILLLTGLASVIAGSVFASPAASAADLFNKACSGADSAICDSKNEGKTRDDAADRVKTIINFALGILGMIAVIMIVIGGFRFVTSTGDEGGVKQAKNTVLYAVIGLIVAIMSYAIVNFVVLGVAG